MLNREYFYPVLTMSLYQYKDQSLSLTCSTIAQFYIKMIFLLSLTPEVANFDTDIHQPVNGYNSVEL